MWRTPHFAEHVARPHLEFNFKHKRVMIQTLQEAGPRERCPDGITQKTDHDVVTIQMNGNGRPKKIQMDHGGLRLGIHRHQHHRCRPVFLIQ